MNEPITDPLDLPVPPEQNFVLYIQGEGQRPLVTVKLDGTVTIHEPGAVPEAAKVFWEALGTHGQSLAYQLKEARAEIESLRQQMAPMDDARTLADLAAIPDCCASDDSMAGPQCFPLGLETARRVLAAVSCGKIHRLRLLPETVEHRPLKERLSESDEEFLQIDGHDNACVGIGRRISKEPLLVYSRKLILDNLQKEGMSEEEAEEFISFNIEGAWVGDLTPIILEELPL